MPRINVEDSIYQDIRFLEMAAKVGGIETALGAMVRAWSLAQKHYLSTDNDRLIPESEWKRQKINPAIIEVGLAEVRQKGIYVCGSESQFNWLIQRSEAGKKSAAAKNAKRDEIQRPLTDVESRQPLPLPLPLPLPHSQPQSQKVITKHVIPEDERKAPSAAFEVLPELDDTLTREILIKISPSAQRRWLRQFGDAEWVKDTLIEAISFYTARGDAMDGQWGVRLHQALNRARAAQKNAKSTGPRTANDPGFWENIFSETKEVGT